MYFVLHGGKSNGSTNIRTEMHLIKLTGKEKPRCLFVPFASPDEEKTITRFKELTRLCSWHLGVLRKKDVAYFEKMVQAADILYFSGGWCDELVSFMKEHHLDEILAKYLDSDKVYCGVSAGAMMVCRAAMGDHGVYSDNFHNFNYQMEECLGYLNITVCPHYQNEDLVVYNDAVKDYETDSFGLEEDTAVIIHGKDYYVLKEDESHSVYLFDAGKNHQMISLYGGNVYEKNSSFRS